MRTIREPQDRLTEALRWSEKRPLDSAPEAEIYAEILLEQARVPSNAGDQKRASEVAASSLRPRFEDWLRNGRIHGDSNMW